MLIAADTCWYLMTHFDTWWHMLIPDDTCWYMMTYEDTCWYLQTYADTDWYLLTYVGTHCHMPIPIDKISYLLRHFETSWHYFTKLLQCVQNILSIRHMTWRPVERTVASVPPFIWHPVTTVTLYIAWSSLERAFLSAACALKGRQYKLSGLMGLSYGRKGWPLTFFSDFY